MTSQNPRVAPAYVPGTSLCSYGGLLLSPKIRRSRAAALERRSAEVHGRL